MLELKNICFQRDNKKILDNINLTIGSNEFIAITGLNGSGKSTLAKIIMGIEKPDTGKIIFKGKDIKRGEACEVLSKVGLCAKEYLDREINSSLSGGELKRIEIATVAVRGTKLTIFDEPEAGIDLWSFNNLIEIFEEMSNIIKGTTLIISHQERILNIADKVILLENGKISKVGNSTEIIENMNIKRECVKIKRG